MPENNYDLKTKSGFVGWVKRRLCAVQPTRPAVNFPVKYVLRWVAQSLNPPYKTE